MKADASRSRLTLGGLAAAGILAAHWLGYLVAAPDPHERAYLLESSGHRFLVPLTALSLGLLVAGLAKFVTARFGGKTASNSSALIPRLAVLQVVGFLGMESVERAVTAEGLTLEAMLQAPILVGVVVQVLFAVLGGLLLSAVGSAVSVLLRREREVGGTPVRWFTSQTNALRPQVASGPCNSRGPPPLS